MAVEDLPEEILFNHILCRLPVKSVLCFRSVCKTWNGMLGEQQFVQLHLKDHQNKMKLLIRTKLSVEAVLSRYYSIDCEDEAVESSVAAPLPEIPGVAVSGKKQLLGSCNGLVAIIVRNDNISGYVLWNPSTRESKYLGDPSPIIGIDNFVGLVYDSILDDYKIIRIRTSIFMEHHVDMYSLRGNSWKKVKGEPYICNISVVNPTQEAGVELNGYIYWMVRIHTSQSDPSITGFSLRDESFTSLRCPLEMSSLSYYHTSYLGLKAMGRSCIAAFHFYMNDKLLVWTLKDPEKKENSWEKLITLSLSSPELKFICLVRPLWFTMDGKVLLIIGFNRGDKKNQHQHNFGVYDPQKKSLESVHIYGIKNTCHVTTEMEYIPSLVSPNVFESGICQGIDNKMHQDIGPKKRKRT